MEDAKQPGSGSSSGDDLLVRAIAALEAGGQSGLDAFLAEHPGEADDVRAQLERLDGFGLLHSSNDDDDAGTPSHLGDFRLEEPLGQGGMGIVYRAVQESLGREVALKVIRPDLLLFAGSRDRFRREVELVARMQHPGIVPIHAVGDEGGVPYFAMELVRGASLADVITHMQGRDPSTLCGEDLRQALLTITESSDESPAGFFAGSWNDVVLRIGREVADALEHAHRRGVLHRDVKPSNVMLTPSGRVLLLDFGLAASDSGEGLTRSGAILGSVPYMPPEMLAGNVQGDPRMDVYSLGVTCWELLALELPYDSTDPIVVRNLTQAADRPKLGSKNGNVPWELETVVATAMDPDPARRYSSAAELSRDLDNVLSHRPILAREPGMALRARRWVQRHPTLATMLTAVTLIVIGAPSVLAYQESRARVRIQAEADHAKTNFEELQRAVDTMLVEVGDKSLRDIPRMSAVRERLLNEALRFYEQFLDNQPDEPSYELEAARIRLRLGNVHGLLGDYPKSVAALEGGLTRLLLEPDPDVTIRHELARGSNRLATALRLCGELERAEQKAVEAAGLWRELRAAAPHLATHGYARTMLEVGLIRTDRGDLRGAIDGLDEVFTVVTEQRNQADADLPVWVDPLEARAADLRGAWSFQLAMQIRDRKRATPFMQQALNDHRRAEELWTAVLAGEPTVQQRGDAAQGAVYLGLLLQTIGKAPAAMESLTRGIELIEQLVAEFPRAPQRKKELANARSNLGALFGSQGQYDECRQQNEIASRLFRELIEQDPNNSEYQLGLAHSQQTLAAIEIYGGEPAAAWPFLDVAAEAANQALSVRPDNASYRRIARKLAETSAELSLTLEDADGAAAAVDVLLAERLGPADPALGAGLLARSSHLLATKGDDASIARASELMTRARGLLRAAIDSGRSLAEIRGQPSMRDQLGKPGFAELCAEFESADK